MPSIRTLPVAFLTTFALVACGSSGDGGAGAGGDREAAAAPSGGAAVIDQAVPCFLRGSMGDAQSRPSPIGWTTLSLGGEEATLCYGRPSVKGREIFGGLVPFGDPWRLGANEATAIHIPFATEIGSVAVEPGAYSIYVVPGESSWNVHVNRNVERWGIPIDSEIAAADVGSFTVSPASTDSTVETLTFEWEPSGSDAGNLVMEWENTRVEIPVRRTGA